MQSSRCAQTSRGFSGPASDERSNALFPFSSTTTQGPDNAFLQGTRPSDRTFGSRYTTRSPQATGVSLRNLFAKRALASEASFQCFSTRTLISRYLRNKFLAYSEIGSKLKADKGCKSFSKGSAVDHP